MIQNMVSTVLVTSETGRSVPFTIGHRFSRVDVSFYTRKNGIGATYY